jgi:Icc protein
MRLIQLTDIHLGTTADALVNDFPVYQSFERVFQLALSLQPDHILCTGDLSDRGELSSYELLENVFRTTDIPISILYGNHDRPSEMMNKRHQKIINLENWRILCLDSVKNDAVWGEGKLSTAEMEWLTDELVSSQEPTIIALHHHPIFFGEEELSWLNLIHLENGKELIELCSAFASVKGIIFGHCHHQITRQIEQIPILGTPSTCYQVNTADEVGSCHWAGLRVMDLCSDGSFSSYVVRSQPAL